MRGGARARAACAIWRNSCLRDQTQTERSRLADRVSARAKRLMKLEAAFRRSAHRVLFSLMAARSLRAPQTHISGSVRRARDAHAPTLESTPNWNLHRLSSPNYLMALHLPPLFTLNVERVYIYLFCLREKRHARACTWKALFMCLFVRDMLSVRHSDVCLHCSALLCSGNSPWIEKIHN